MGNFEIACADTIQERLSACRTNLLMGISLLFAASRMSRASSVEQLRSMVVLGPGGRFEIPSSPYESMPETEILASTPSSRNRARPSSNRIARMTMCKTYPLMVCRCRAAAARIAVASDRAQFSRRTVRSLFRMQYKSISKVAAGVILDYR
jgi:hypothetical protein